MPGILHVRVSSEDVTSSLLFSIYAIVSGSTVVSTHSMKVLDSTIFLGPPCVEFACSSMFGWVLSGDSGLIDGYEIIQITKKAN